MLVVDATNVLSRAAGARFSSVAAGTSLARLFADWLAFLQLFAQSRLTVAVFDAPRSKRQQQGPQLREMVAAEYLQRRKQRSVPQQWRGGDTLRPFKQAVADKGGLSLVAPPGFEADDVISAAVALLRAAAPTATLAVASGDGDVAQLLDGCTSWLRLHSLPSAATPLGVSWMDAPGFETDRGFPPAALPDYLALTGAVTSSKSVGTL